MQQELLDHRIKRHHHKSRNGCTTCKQRRFKCDERKPTCLRCILSDRQCVYRVPQAKLFPPALIEVSVEPALPPAMSNVITDPVEQRSLAYFNERAKLDFTGFTSYTETFWSCLIPSLSQAEPAIRHIAIGISSKHEALRSTGERSGEIATFGIKHHSMALQCLTELSRDEKAEILLVSCIAFILLERLSDPYAVEGRYLDYVIAGMRILGERRQYQNPSCRNDGAFNLIDDFLEPMFFQIELVFSIFCKPQRLIRPRVHPSPIGVPAVFDSLEMARDVFFQICVCSYLLTDERNDEADSFESFQRIKVLLHQWCVAFDAYMSKKSEQDPSERKNDYFFRQQVCLFIGALLFSAREDIPVQHSCRPAVVDLSAPSKIHIFVRVEDERKVNLSGINKGRPAAMKDFGAAIWPHAKRMRVDGGNDFILLELSQT